MAIITVSRTPGSRGDELAQAVAERLGYRLVRRPELARLAAELGGPDAWERSPELRERSPSFWERLNEERRRYAAVLRGAVLHLAQADNVVVVGLGAGQLLKELGNVLRLQVVAPTQARLAWLQEQGDDEQPGPLSPERARERLRHLDREAAGYMRYLFSIDWLEPHHWDLVINSGRLPIPVAVEMVAGLVERGTLAPAAADVARLAGLALASRVEAALLNNSGVWVNALRVTPTPDGGVLLEGEVMTEEDREAAEQVARAVPGVGSVGNDLRVQPPPLTGM